MNNQIFISSGFSTRSNLLFLDMCMDFLGTMNTNKCYLVIVVTCFTITLGKSTKVLRIMGRKHYSKRKSRSTVASASASSTGCSATEGTYFTSREKYRVRQYLSDYRTLATLQQSSPNNNHEPIQTSQHVQQEANIAGIVFPSLTIELVSQPYLCLPSKLSFRQRQFVHDCCIERKFLPVFE